MRLVAPRRSRNRPSSSQPRRRKTAITSRRRPPCVPEALKSRSCDQSHRPSAPPTWACSYCGPILVCVRRGSPDTACSRTLTGTVYATPPKLPPEVSQEETCSQFGVGLLTPAQHQRVTAGPLSPASPYVPHDRPRRHAGGSASPE